ncbi:MAG TPA: tyrosine-type recombinase/integrase [Syntrophorhabdaceae bacterium]|nr:tyrosine-type recombinase/integrase [Syntrophorhabdaceae bacterium]
MRKRGDGWHVDIHVSKSERYYYTVKGTKEEAYEYEQELRRELAHKKPLIRATISDKVVDYLRWVKQQQPKSHRIKKYMLMTRIIPFFGNITPDRITPEMILLYKEKRKQEIASKMAKGGSRMINLELLCLQHMIRQMWGERAKFEQLPWKADKPMILSRDEIRSFINALEPEYGVLFFCIYQTGMRKSEALNLTWDRVDLDEGYLLAKGKGDKTRVIPMTPLLKKYLICYHNFVHGDKLVFPSARTGKPLVGIYKAIARAKKAAGIEKRVYPHLLRHCFGTHIIDGGSDVASLQELLGHANISTTAIYTHLSMDYKREAVNKGVGEW